MSSVLASMAIGHAGLWRGLEYGRYHLGVPHGSRFPRPKPNGVSGELLSEQSKPRWKFEPLPRIDFSAARPVPLCFARGQPDDGCAIEGPMGLRGADPREPSLVVLDEARDRRPNGDIICTEIERQARLRTDRPRRSPPGNNLLQ